VALVFGTFVFLTTLILWHYYGLALWQPIIAITISFPLAYLGTRCVDINVAFLRLKSLPSFAGVPEKRSEHFELMTMHILFNASFQRTSILYQWLLRSHNFCSLVLLRTSKL
jgi:hypothetical protein